MIGNKIRLLEASEIECRVGSIGKNGLSLLLYKDARVDQKILDECFSPCGWKRTHQEIGGNLYCTVEVWDAEKQQWIAKQDVGTESYTEKKRGRHRTASNVPVSTGELGESYIRLRSFWIPVEKAAISYDGKRYTTSEHFRVSAISYASNWEIESLEICNAKGGVVFRMQSAGTSSNKPGSVSETAEHICRIKCGGICKKN